LIVHSGRLREDLAAFLGPGHPPIRVTPHGVWELPGPPVEPAGGEWDGPLLFFGVIRPNKGLHVLVQAMDRLPHLRLIAAGSPEGGDYMRRLRDAIGGLAPGRVELVDRYIDDHQAADLFGRCRLVILPYTAFASQSGVLHLAVAHGRPVVATDVGALGESVRAWGIGEVVAPDDERGLAAAIEAALEPARYRAAIDAIGRMRAEMSWEKTAELTLDVYDSILTGRGGIRRPRPGRRDEETRRDVAAEGHRRRLRGERCEDSSFDVRASSGGHASAGTAGRGAGS
jgi:glycosyltransferase involved in cell wall biosynthesis